MELLSHTHSRFQSKGQRHHDVRNICFQNIHPGVSNTVFVFLTQHSNTQRNQFLLRLWLTLAVSHIKSLITWIFVSFKKNMQNLDTCLFSSLVAHLFDHLWCNLKIYAYETFLCLTIVFIRLYACTGAIPTPAQNPTTFLCAELYPTSLFFLLHVSNDFVWMSANLKFTRQVTQNFFIFDADVHDFFALYFFYLTP